MAKLPNVLNMISLLATISTVFGCGVMPAGQVKMNMPSCLIVDDRVTGICTTTMEKMCSMTSDAHVKITAIDGTHLTISGTLSTRNIIMANWSRMMWQDIMNRAVRTLASGPFGSHFFSASGTVVGKLNLNFDVTMRNSFHFGLNMGRESLTRRARLPKQASMTLAYQPRVVLKILLQIKWLAMRQRLPPSFAITFMSKVEAAVLSRDPLLWCQFIDDCFTIYSTQEEMGHV
ncbi:hypothetical protein KIN20_015185 [Parelaphostrongylus tenuis]|uniref:Uncharacterized protein n=1 Tax=Parelaphostrongylus tenuis TaxID=148309 RepID=A0AAD5QPP6_PARTN|nr:hypothetical protein KIN20_015185 [Parelaphostrongylus tenuis]